MSAGSDDLRQAVAEVQARLDSNVSRLVELCRGIERWVDAGLELRAAVDRTVAKQVKLREEITRLIEHRDGDADWWKKQ